MKIKRFIVLLLFDIFFFILQSTVVNKIQLGNVVPNICLILIVSIAYFNGSSTAVFHGFIIGLLFDVFFGDFIGLFSLFYVLTAYLCGLFHKTFYDYNFDLKLPTILFIASCLAHNMITYVCYFLLDGDLSFRTYLYDFIIPDLLYTVIAGSIIYRFLFLLDQKLSLDERKADGYFVS